MTIIPSAFPLTSAGARSFDYVRASEFAVRPALHSLAFEQVVPYPSYPRDRRTDEKSMKGLASCRRYICGETSPTV